MSDDFNIPLANVKPHLLAMDDKLCAPLVENYNKNFILIKKNNKNFSFYKKHNKNFLL